MNKLKSISMLLLLFCLTNLSVFASAYIQFDQVSYVVGDEVIVDIYADVPVSIHNDFQKSCTEAEFGSNSLGTINLPGIYLVKFKYGKRYREFIFYVGETYEDSSIHSLSKAKKKLKELGFWDPYVQFIENEDSEVWIELLKGSFTDVFAQKQVAIPVTIIACVGTASNPFFISYCTGGLKDLGGTFVDILITKMVDQMYEKGYLTAEERSHFMNIKFHIKSALTFFNFYDNGESVADILQFGLSNIENTSEVLGNQSLSLMSGMQSDLVEKTVFVLDIANHF